MDWVALLIDNAFPIVGSLIIMALAWGLRKLNISAQLKEAIVDMTQRVIDKSEERLQIATAEDSPGGKKVTKEELSQLRQEIWVLLIAETKGPMGRLLKAWGEERVKGLIGGVLEKMGIVKTHSEDDSE